MAKKFKGKYRIESARWKDWDYSSNAWYFVTICTKQGRHYLGGINGETIGLSVIGEIALKFWREIPNHFPFVKLGAHVVLPNHMHGIIEIAKPAGLGGAAATGLHPVETQHVASLPGTGTAAPTAPPKHMNTFGPQKGNLASIIRSFKASVKRYANKQNVPFVWQERYHDEVILDEQTLDSKSAYILRNPERWLAKHAKRKNI